MANENTLARIVAGRTDLVFDYVSSGTTAKAKDRDGVSHIEWCAYYGDVSAIRFLLLPRNSHSESRVFRLQLQQREIPTSRRSI
jgi:hypothetical protein